MKAKIQKTIKNSDIYKYFSNKNKLGNENLSIHSPKILIWKCEKGHEWKTSATKIQQGGRCPFCYGRYATRENNLESIFPEIAKEWDYAKNNCKPSEICPRSGKLFNWKCEKGHEWKATPHNRTQYRKNGYCPYCVNKMVDKYNCLQNSQKYAYLLAEWDYSRNTISPSDVTIQSTTRIKWKCKKGHEWETTLRQRTIARTKCPHCRKIELKDGTILDSYVEAYFYLKLKTQYDVIKLHKRYPQSKMKCDFYIPMENKYIEVTSYMKGNIRGNDIKFYRHYLRKIVKKKKIAIQNNSKFQFIQHILSKEDWNLVKNNIKR